MSSKKPHSKPRPKLSFAVDRDEIGITSEWADTFISGPVALVRNNATGAESAPGADSSSGADNATGAPDLDATVEQNVPVVQNTTVALKPPVAITATVEEDGTGLDHSTVEPHTSVALSTTDAGYTNRTSPEYRRPKAKPLRSVADGLTPGQLLVYTQMYAKGEGQGTRFYRGGYQSLCALTGLSKRGLQNVIGELQAKSVVSIETAPGHKPTQVSVYRVRPEGEVLQFWHAAGLRFVIGKGKVLLRQPPI